MLNINKIDSDFNKKNLHVTDIAKILDQPYTTVIHKKKKGNWSPNDIEKIAEFFDRSILYYFDRDTEPNTAKEPEIKYFSCPDCIEKQKEIDRLSEQLKDKNELLDFYRGKKENHFEDCASHGEDTKRTKTG